jgi:hypothetical protein
VSNEAGDVVHAASPHRHLPRLSRQVYQGRAFVHWSMTVKDRRKGWLDDLFHARFREDLLHAAVPTAWSARRTA